VNRLLDNWPLAALLASAAMLAIAHAFETFAGLAPCTLCLRQREVYWAAMAIAAAGLVLQRTPIRAVAARGVGVMLALAFLCGAGWALYHVGAEWKWWPGPASCSGGASHVSMADMSRLLHGGKFALPQCDMPAWVFLGLSMAGWNCLISLGLAGASATAAMRGPAP
jgi:disulfide bond formation protein DsbB